MERDFIFNTVELEQNENIVVNCPEGFYFDVDEFCLDELQEYATAHGINISPVVFMGYNCDSLVYDLEHSAFYSKNERGIVYKLDDRYDVIKGV